MTPKEVTELIRDYLATGRDDCNGVKIYEVSEKKKAIAVEFDDGSIFGITIESLKK